MEPHFLVPRPGIESYKIVGAYFAQHCVGVRGARRRRNTRPNYWGLIPRPWRHMILSGRHGFSFFVEDFDGGLATLDHHNATPAE